MIAWNFQRIVGTCQFRVPWFGYPCGYSSLTINHTFMGAEHSNVGDTVILFLKTNEGSILGDSYRINCSVFGRYTLNKDSYIRPEFIVENDNPEKITTYSNMDTFEFSVSKSMLEDKLSQQ